MPRLHVRGNEKNRLFLWTGLFYLFSAGNNWIINRFCLEWAEIITQRDDALRINSPVQKDAFSGMNRRRFLKSSMAVAAVCGTSGVASLFSQAAFAEDAGIADGQTLRFDYAVLQAMAHDLARQPWGGAPRDLPPTLANLTPQAYNSIQYDANHSLWNNIEERKLDIQFFHVGMGFRRRVRMFSLDASTQQAREIHFRPELFKYNDAGVDTRQLEGQSDLGFAGFRVFKAPELARRDIVAFLGASYFRAVDSTYQYGLSARGLAVDTFTDTPEEFRYVVLVRNGQRGRHGVYRLRAAGQPEHHWRLQVHHPLPGYPGYHGRGKPPVRPQGYQTAGYRADDQYVQLRQ